MSKGVGGAQGKPRDPALHTAVISDVEGMFWKLVWDIDQFDQIQRSLPDLREPLGYAAINVCIASTSLRDWTVEAVLQRDPHRTKQEVLDHIHQYVPQQHMCAAIANTSKHSEFRERGWVGGHVSLDYDEPGEDDPGGMVMRHIHDGAVTSLALNAFMSLERCWWGELQNLGFAFPHIRPEWWQRRIRAIFGPHVHG